MAKKIDKELEKAYEAMVVYHLTQEKIKEVKKEGIEDQKEIILEVMKTLGMDVIEFDNDPKDTKKLKAMKYSTLKLECEDEEGLFNYLKLKGLHNKVFKKVPDMTVLNSQFEKGNISLQEVKKFLTYKEGEVFKLQKVNKIKS